MDQPNRAHRLTDVLLCVDDPCQASTRFGRFVGRAAGPAGDGAFQLDLDRGRLSFVTPQRLRELLPEIEIPTTPFMAAIALNTSEPTAMRRALQHGRIPVDEPARRVVVAKPPGVATTVVFTADGARAPWLTPR